MAEINLKEKIEEVCGELGGEIVESRAIKSCIVDERTLFRSDLTGRGLELRFKKGEKETKIVVPTDVSVKFDYRDLSMWIKGVREGDELDITVIGLPVISATESELMIWMRTRGGRKKE